MPIFLTLGPITFANFEIPESIPFGGAQMLAVHKLLGGQRVIQSMGRDDDDYTWEGIFMGSTAQFRAQYLDSLRIAGSQQTLSYSNFNYAVVIKHFEAKFERYYQIPYKITVTVVQDLNQPFTTLLPVTYNDAVIALMAEAQNLANAIAEPNVTNSIALLAYTLEQVGNLDNATSAALQTITVPLMEAQAATSTAITNTTAALFP
jgi:hypothetical protein